MTPVDQMRLLAAVRIGFGTAMVAAPRLNGRMWLGSRAMEQRQVESVLRGFGARDIGLGLGILLALKRDRSPRGWLEAGALADLGDMIGGLAAGKHLPLSSRVLVPLGAGAAAALGLKLAAECREES